jgi:hypothetical protein
VTTDRDIAPLVRSWLHDDPDGSAERLLDAALAIVDTTPQRSAARWPARRPTMNTIVRIGVAAAVLAMAVALGYSLISQNVGAPGPEPTVAPTPAPFSHHAASRSGTYVIDWELPGRIVFTVPTGWSPAQNAPDSVGVLKDNGGAPSGAGLGFFEVRELLTGICGRWMGPTLIGPTIDDFVDAVAEPATSRPTAIAGYRGIYAEFDGLSDLAPCPPDRGLWTTHGGGSRGIFGPAERNRVWVLDVGGRRLVINAFHYDSTDSAARQELDAMIESIRIVP